MNAVDPKRVPAEEYIGVMRSGFSKEARISQANLLQCFKNNAPEKAGIADFVSRRCAVLLERMFEEPIGSIRGSRPMVMEDVSKVEPGWPGPCRPVYKHLEWAAGNPLYWQGWPAMSRVLLPLPVVASSFAFCAKQGTVSRKEKLVETDEHSLASPC